MANIIDFIRNILYIIHKGKCFMEKRIVALRACEDYNQDNVDRAVEQLLADLGGMAKFIKPDMNVVLKVNLVSKATPTQAVTTHHAVVEAVAKQVVALGAKCIIADSPASRYTEGHLKAIYEASGMTLASHNSGAELNHNFDSVKLELPEAERLRHTEIIDVVDKADAVINICKMKTHELTGFSGCVKNLYGVIPGLIKAQTHALFPKLKDFCNALIDLHEGIKDKIVLNIVDAVVGMEGPGPTAGTPRIVNRIFASEDAFSADAVMVRLMNVDPATMPLLKEAVRRKLIDPKLEPQVVGDNLEESIIRDYKTIFVTSEAYSAVVPKWFQPTFRRMFQRRPTIKPNACKGCRKCFEHCPAEAIRMEYDRQGGMYSKIDYKKCINCFCCQEVCPFKVVKVKVPLGYKIIQKKQLKRDKQEAKRLREESNNTPVTQEAEVETTSTKSE